MAAAWPRGWTRRPSPRCRWTDFQEGKRRDSPNDAVAIETGQTAASATSGGDGSTLYMTAHGYRIRSQGQGFQWRRTCGAWGDSHDPAEEARCRNTD
jgi:hypothetical protein